MSRPLAIAFLACNKNPARFREDASFVYRCENLAAALAKQGHKVLCEHFTRFDWASSPDLVVFHRPQLTPRLWLLMSWLRQREVRLVADVDDLIFDPAMAHLSPAVLSGRAEPAAIERRFKRHRQALQRFGYITASTEPLRDELLALPGLAQRAHVQVVPNAVHHSWSALGRQLHEDEGGPAALIRYLPGTRSHDRDFAQIAAPLAAVLRERPGLRLEIVGPLDGELALPPHQVTRREKLPFDRYHQAVRGARVNLAPLEDTRFTRCKSALKVIEAGFWNVPTVCSPLPDARRLAHAGAFAASTAAEWRHWLTRLLDDDGFHAQQATGLRARVMAHANVHSVAADWLQGVMQAPRQPASAALRA